MSIECWKCGSEVKNNTSPHYCSSGAVEIPAEPRTVRETAEQPLCYCGHALVRHHGPLGSNQCLDDSCKACSGFVDASTDYGRLMASLKSAAR